MNAIDSREGWVELVARILETPICSLNALKHFVVRTNYDRNTVEALVAYSYVQLVKSPTGSSSDPDVRFTFLALECAQLRQYRARMAEWNDYVGHESIDRPKSKGKTTYIGGIIAQFYRDREARRAQARDRFDKYFGGDDK